VLEFASGSGMHINFFASYFKELQFHPSDKSDETFENIQILIAEQNNANVAAPIKLDLTLAETWPEAENIFLMQYFVSIFFRWPPPPLRMA
jgi:hypothetical protein